MARSWTPDLGLPSEPPGGWPQKALGRVNFLFGPDNSHANVSVAGTAWHVLIPGSVRGVKAGQSVWVQIDRNTRVIQAVASAIPRQSYTASDQGTRDINSSLAGTVSGGGGGSIGSPPFLSTIDPAYNVFIDDFDDVRTMQTKTNTAFDRCDNNFDDIANYMQQVENAIDSIAGIDTTEINQLRQNVDELRQIVNTLISDLRDQGMVQ